MKKILLPVESLLSGIPKITLKDGAVAAVAHGAPLASVGVVGLHADLQRGNEVLMVSLKGEAVALATMTVNGEDVANMKGGEVARPNLVLMATDVYPKRW